MERNQIVQGSYDFSSRPADQEQHLIDLGDRARVVPRYAVTLHNEDDIDITVVLYNEEMFSDGVARGAEVARFILEASDTGMAIVEGLYITDRSYMALEPDDNVEGVVLYTVRELSDG